MNKVSEKDYNDCIDVIARSVMFGSGTINLNELMGNKIEFRKGKDLESIKKALKKAYSQKTYKTEMEFSWFVLYLKDVFKKVR